MHATNGAVDVDQTAEHVAALLYSGAVYILATDPGTLKDRVSRAYRMQAVLANRLMHTLPHSIADEIGELQMSLGQGHSVSGDLDGERLAAAIDGMDDTRLTRVSERICFITSDLLTAAAPHVPDGDHRDPGSRL
jgi:hypothetical protein